MITHNEEIAQMADRILQIEDVYKRQPVYVSYDERNKKYITTRFESRLNYISKEEFTFFEEKAKEMCIRDRYIHCQIQHSQCIK